MTELYLKIFIVININDAASYFKYRWKYWIWKSTLYNNLKKYYDDRSDICFVPEPVNDWKNIVDSENVPILTNLYKNTTKFAFSSNDGIYITSTSFKTKVKENKYKIIISERSVETDKNVFAKMLYDDGMMNMMNIKFIISGLMSF